jgi:hypothetical protein
MTEVKCYDMATGNVQTLECGEYMEMVLAWLTLLSQDKSSEHVIYLSEVGA